MVQRFAHRGLARFFAALWLVLATSLLVPAALVPGWPTLILGLPGVVALAMAWRCLHLAVTIGPDGVLVAGPLRTRRYALDEVGGFHVDPQTRFVTLERKDGLPVPVVTGSRCEELNEALTRVGGAVGAAPRVAGAHQVRMKGAHVASFAWTGVVLAAAFDCPRVDASIALAVVASVAGLGWARVTERRMRAATPQP